MTPDAFADTVFKQVDAYTKVHPSGNGLISWSSARSRVCGRIVAAARGPKGSEAIFRAAREAIPEGWQNNTIWSWDFVIMLALVEIVTTQAVGHAPTATYLRDPDGAVRSQFYDVLRALGFEDVPGTDAIDELYSTPSHRGTLLQRVLLQMMTAAAERPAPNMVQ